MKTNISKKIAYWASVIVIGAVVGVALQFAKAWSEPTLPPPTNNVGAPITTGNADQLKTGGYIAVRDDQVLAYNSANGHYGYLNYSNGQYGGIFYGDYGLLSQNLSTYTYLNTDLAGFGSSWGVYTNGNMYANNAYLATRGWLSNVGTINYGLCTYPNAVNPGHNWDAFCPANYVMTGFRFRDSHDNHRATTIQCCALF